MVPNVTQGRQIPMILQRLIVAPSEQRDFRGITKSDAVDKIHLVRVGVDGIITGTTIYQDVAKWILSKSG